ncbi:cyclin-A1-4-like [Fagus crenata]
MSTCNRRPPPSSSKKPSVSNYPIKKATKPQLAKKRPALADVTNQRNVPHTISRISESSSMPLIHSDRLVCAFALRISLLREMISGGEEAPVAAGSLQPLEWKFAQVFGERTAGEEVQEGSISNSDFKFIDLILIYLFI